MRADGDAQFSARDFGDCCAHVSVSHVAAFGGNPECCSWILEKSSPVSQPAINSGRETSWHRPFIRALRLGFLCREDHPPFSIDFLEMSADFQKRVIAQADGTDGEQGHHQPIAIHPGTTQVSHGVRLLSALHEFSAAAPEPATVDHPVGAGPWPRRALELALYPVQPLIVSCWIEDFRSAQNAL